MNAKIYLAGVALSAVAGIGLAGPCVAQPYGNGPQYSTPAEQAQTRALNERAIDGSTQSPAQLNGEAPSDYAQAGQPYGQSYPQRNGYGSESGTSGRGYSNDDSNDAGPRAGNPNAGGYGNEPYSNPPQSYGYPVNAPSADYDAQPPSRYGNPNGYADGPPRSLSGPSQYGQPQSYNGRQPSADQLRYDREAERYRQQQAQYRHEQQRYRGALDDYDHAMDEWYNAPPVEEYP